MTGDGAERGDSDRGDPTDAGDATRSPGPERSQENAAHLLAVENRVDELAELRESLPGRAPLLAGMLGPLYFYGGIFLLATGAVVLVLAVVDGGALVPRLAGAVVVVGIGWVALHEGRELRSAAPGTRERMIELEDELGELREREPWAGRERTGDAEESRDGPTRLA